MARPLRLVVILLALAAVGTHGQQPVIAVQSGMQDYGVRRQSWTSPTTGIVYIADDPYVTNLGSTTTRCYGAQNIVFANGEDELYQCTRAADVINYRFPNIPNGNYRLILIESEDKWTEFRNGNNGREFHVIIEGQFRDSISPFGKLGLRQAALQLEYCVTITDGDLTLSLDKRMFTDSGYPAILCGLRLEVDDGSRGACPTPLTRYDPYWIPYRGVWTYSINCAGGPWRSPNGFMWQLDYAFYQASAGVLVASGTPIGYDGMRATDSLQLRNSDDIPVFQRRRVGDDTRYSIPLASGNYMVVIWFLEWSDGAAIQWTYGGRKFDMFFEGQLVKTVDIYATCGAAYRACPMVFRNVAVTDGFLDVSFGNPIKLSATINGIQIKPEDGTPVPAYINYPGKFLADTGKDRPFNWPGVQGNVLYAINAGGGEVIAPDGLLFTVDWNYAAATSGTSLYGSPSITTNTNYTGVYQAQRRSSTAVTYTLPVYDAGTYTVRVYMCEYEYNTGTRVVSVTLQGQKVDQFDILARAGGQHAALEIDYEVTVTAGQSITLAVGYVSGRDALLNAVEVRTGPKTAPRAIPPLPPPPVPPQYEQFPVPWNGNVPAPTTVAPGPFPPYVGKTMPDGRELVFAINFAPPKSQCCCDCSGPPCGCGEYVSTEGITYMEPFPFFVPPYNTPLCYGSVSGVHVRPGANVPYANDLALGSCFAGDFRAYFPNIAPGEYRLRTLHHEEKWATVLEFAQDGTGGRGGYLDINGLRIDTQDYLQRAGEKSVLFYIDHCITVDSRGYIEMASSTLPQQSSGPRIQAMELWKKDWNTTCPFSIYDRQDLIADGGECFVPVTCIPCNGNFSFYGVLPCLRPWTAQGAIEYAINCGGTPMKSNVSGIYYSVDTKFGFGPYHRTGYAVGYDNNNGVIDGTEDDWLFTQRRSDSHGYWLPVSRPGRYLLIIGAMEWDRGYIGGRRWDLTIEDQFVETIDVFNRCGAAYRACYFAYYINVWDGMLNTWVQVRAGGAGVNTMLVIRDDGSATIPTGIYIPPQDKPYNWKLQSGNVLLAINCGGGELVDPGNNFMWFTDTYYSTTDRSGTSQYGAAPSSSTIYNQVYLSQRQGDVVRYDVILPATGMTLTLEIFCNEYEYAQSGRSMRISVENGTYTDGPFDVWTCAGNTQNECKRTIANIVVPDNVLSFQAERVSGRNALISAFRVTATAGLPANAATPPPRVLPVIGSATCPAGGLGCPCTAGGTCNAPYVCSRFGGCQVQPPPAPTTVPTTAPPTAAPATFPPAPTFPTTVSTGAPKSTKGGSNKTATIVAVVVVLVVLAIIAAAVLLYVFRERLFGSKTGHRPTFHEEEMYAPKQ